MGLAQLLAAAKGPVGAGGSPGIPNRAYNAGPPILYPGAINNGNNYAKMAIITQKWPRLIQFERYDNGRAIP